MSGPFQPWSDCVIEVVPPNPPGTKCAKLDGKSLHQEGREIANFPWFRGGVGVGRIVDGETLKVSEIQAKREEEKV